MSVIEIKRAGVEGIETAKLLSEANRSDKAMHYWDRCTEGINNGEIILLIAEKDGESAGYGLLNWRPKYRIYQHLDIPEIQDLNVIPPFRRQGVARAMIAACESIGRENRKKQMGISFGLSKEYGPAQRLYIEMGYLPDGFGVTYDRELVSFGQMRPVDDDLCLMLVKDL